MPGTSNVDQAPPDGCWHGGPVGPCAVLESAVQVQQKERNYVSQARLRNGRFPPRLERCRRVGVLGCALLGEIGVLRKFGDRADLTVEVAFKGRLERVHDPDKLRAGEVVGCLEAGQVVLELGETGKECLLISSTAESAKISNAVLSQSETYRVPCASRRIPPRPSEDSQSL